MTNYETTEKPRRRPRRRRPGAAPPFLHLAAVAALLLFAPGGLCAGPGRVLKKEKSNKKKLSKKDSLKKATKKDGLLSVDGGRDPEYASIMVGDAFIHPLASVDGGRDPEHAPRITGREPSTDPVAIGVSGGRSGYTNTLRTSSDGGDALPLSPSTGPMAYSDDDDNWEIMGVSNLNVNSLDTDFTPNGVSAASCNAGQECISRFSATHAVRGMMFDVTAKHPVRLTSLGLNLLHAGENLDVTLFRKKTKGPWNGSAKKPGDWQKILRRAVRSNGQDKPSPFWKKGSQIELAAGETQAFYVWVADPRRSLLVAAGSADTDTSTSNFDLTIDPVIYSAKKFEEFYMHWIFNGRMRYERIVSNGKINMPHASFSLPDMSDNESVRNEVVMTDHKEATHFETGAVFQVRAETAITVVNLQLFFRYSLRETVSIWTKWGGYNASTFKAGKWKFLGKTEVDARNGSDCKCFTPLPLGSMKQARINEGGVRSFYVTLKDSRNLLISNKRDTGDESGRKDGKAVLVVGKSVQQKFGQLFPNFEWIGGVEYISDRTG
eukprot:CAMPEP_0194317164 /NCGR_PEP_ID=MMETSP0171-20130528/13909_1 /TAXON_ID=218684 /ORGANISM="Corethron pennatum, Strain L29A3" /LENGTH=548 /DNA_ID=CAMNT_0039073661 /DNA_START=239 /DNA_END=1885 /DNA_ORIENTATION=-